MSIRSLFLVLAAAFLAGACSSTPVRDIGLDKFAPRKAEQELSSGLKSYENGNYRTAETYLQNALNDGLTFKSDRVTAHKYLAFVYCVSDRKMQCREQFKEARDINPGFELSAAEADHPIWGPVFRQVQAAQSPQKK